MLFLMRWMTNTVAVVVAANIIPGIEYGSVTALFAASLLLGVFNALIRPLLLVLSLPLVVLTMGLFTLVINALMLMFVGQLVASFVVAGFWPAFWGGLIIGAVSLILNTITGTGEHRIDLHTEPPRKRPPEDGDGPIIDV